MSLEIQAINFSKQEINEEIERLKELISGGVEQSRYTQIVGVISGLRYSLDVIEDNFKKIVDE